MPAGLVPPGTLLAGRRPSGPIRPWLTAGCRTNFAGRSGRCTGSRGKVGGDTRGVRRTRGRVRACGRLSAAARADLRPVRPRLYGGRPGAAALRCRSRGPAGTSDRPAPPTDCPCARSPTAPPAARSPSRWKTSTRTATWTIPARPPARLDLDEAEAWRRPSDEAAALLAAPGGDGPGRFDPARSGQWCPGGVPARCRPPRPPTLPISAYGATAPSGRTGAPTPSPRGPPSRAPPTSTSAPGTRPPRSSGTPTPWPTPRPGSMPSLAGSSPGGSSSRAAPPAGCRPGRRNCWSRRPGYEAGPAACRRSDENWR